MTVPKKSPKNQPKTRLTELRIGEGSFVDAGDNPGAPLKFFKEKPGEPNPPLEEDLVVELPTMSRMDKILKFLGIKKFHDGEGMFQEARTTSEILAADKFRHEFWKLRMAFTESVDSIVEMSPGDEMALLMTTTVDEFVSEARKLAAEVTKGSPESERELLDILDSLSQTASVAGKTAETPESLTKRHEEFANAISRLDEFELPDPPEDPMPAEKKKTHTKAVADILAKMSEEERTVMDGALAEMVAEPAAAPAAEVVLAPTPEGELSPETLKSLPLDVQKALADAAATAKRAEEKADRLEKESKDAGYLAKAAKHGVVGVDKAAVAKAYRVIDEHEDGESVLQVIKALTAQIDKSDVLLESIGMTTGNDTTGDAQQKADKLVAELRKIKPDLTEEQAMTEVLRSNKGLYADIDAESKAA